MKPLFVLLSVFLITLGCTRLFRSGFDYSLSGRVALSAMLLFTAIGHFVFTKGMSMMLPEFVPLRVQLIYLTGVLEIAAAAGILVPGLRSLTGILLILFFIAVLPANIYAAVKQINYQTGEADGMGVAYLWFRVPFQLVLIFWTYFFAVR